MLREQIHAILAQFRAGDSVFIGGSTAEPRPFVEAIQQVAATLPELEIVHSFIPGVNPVPLASEDNALRETAVFPRPKCTPVELIPGTYHDYYQYLAQRRFDWAILHLSPPDEQGRCSLGPTVEFMPAVLRRTEKLIGVINTQMPRIPGSAFVELERLDHQCEIDAPLITYDAGEVDAVSEQISANLAGLIEDGSILQLGLGKVPTRLLSGLTDRRKLRFHTGLLTSGFIDLAAAGALDENFKHATCASLGNAEFYQQLSETDVLTIAGVEYTHAPQTLAGLDALIAINSGLQVDLSGQANLEYMGERRISSVGGAPNFARAASKTANGKSVIALPATAAKGTVSRIVTALNPGQPASLTSQEIDYVVTEYGVAHICSKNALERAAALAEIAAPEFREGLLARAKQ